MTRTQHFPPCREMAHPARFGAERSWPAFDLCVYTTPRTQKPNMVLSKTQSNPKAAKKRVRASVVARGVGGGCLVHAGGTPPSAPTRHRQAPAKHPPAPSCPIGMRPRRRGNVPGIGVRTDRTQSHIRNAREPRAHAEPCHAELDAAVACHPVGQNAHSLCDLLRR